MSRVRIDGLPELIRRCLGIKDLPRTKKAVRQAGELVLREMREYPPERHGRAILSRDAEKRKRQLRAIFAKLKNGEIPYRRTRRLARGWRMDTRSVSTDMSVAVTNAVSYAHWVQSQERQTEYHRLTGWRTAEMVLDQTQARVVNIVFEALDGDVKGGKGL